MVPEGVVDLLEAVEVDTQDRHPFAVGSDRCQHLVQPLEHHCAVGQAGQRVVIGKVLGPGFAGEQLVGHRSPPSHDHPGAKTHPEQSEQQRNGQILEQQGARTARRPGQGRKGFAIGIAQQHPPMFADSRLRGYQLQIVQQITLGKGLQHRCVDRLGQDRHRRPRPLWQVGAKVWLNQGCDDHKSLAIDLGKAIGLDRRDQNVVLAGALA